MGEPTPVQGAGGGAKPPAAKSTFNITGPQLSRLAATSHLASAKLGRFSLDQAGFNQFMGQFYNTAYSAKANGSGTMTVRLSVDAKGNVAGVKIDMANYNFHSTPAIKADKATGTKGQPAVTDKSQVANRMAADFANARFEPTGEAFAIEVPVRIER